MINFWRIYLPKSPVLYLITKYFNAFSFVCINFNVNSYKFRIRIQTIKGTGQLCESFAQLPRPRDYRDYSIASIALNRPVFQFVAVL